MNSALWVTTWFLLLTASPTEAPSIPEIVARSIEFHGGDLYRKTRSSFDICSKSGCFSVTTRVQGGQFDHEVAEAQGERQRWVRSTNGEVEVHEFGKALEISPDQEQKWRDWVMARVYFALLPFRLQDPSVRYQDLGLVDWADRSLHRVKVTFETGSSSDASDEFMYWFDPQTSRLELFAYTYENSDGSQGMRFRRLSNYRRIGGLLFFDQENLGREDHLLGLEQISAASLDDQLKPISMVRLRKIRVQPN